MKLTDNMRKILIGVLERVIDEKIEKSKKPMDERLSSCREEILREVDNHLKDYEIDL